MMILILMGVLVGAVLGLRFKVFVLVPAICGALAIVVVDGIARGDGLLRLVLTMITIAMALQLGYILGTVVRFVDTTSRGRNSMPTSARMGGSA
jgi:hypothetical protein